MKKWMYVVIAIVVVLGVVLAVRLAPGRPLINSGANDVVNGVPVNGAPDNGVPVNGAPDNGVPDNGVPGNGDLGNGDPDSSVPLVAGATSLQYTVEWTNGERMVWRYWVKDIGTEKLKVRVEVTNGYDAMHVVNGDLRKVWMVFDGEWIVMPDEQWDQWWDEQRADLEAHVSELHDWTDGDWTYVEPYTGYRVRIYGIQVNPDLPDSLFRP